MSPVNGRLSRRRFLLGVLGAAALSTTDTLVPITPRAPSPRFPVRVDVVYGYGVFRPNLPIRLSDVVEVSFDVDDVGGFRMYPDAVSKAAKALADDIDDRFLDDMRRSYQDNGA